jgi:hypothetical protein
MSEQKNMSIFTTKRDTPYLVDEDMAQLLLDSRPEPETQDVITECARVFETMSIRTVKKDESAHDKS